MNAKRLIAILVLVMMVAFAGVLTAYAQDVVTPEPPPITIPPVWPDSDLEIAYQHVDVTIEDQVATTHVEQLFVNNNDWMLEGTYLFPLPSGAAVSQLTMWVDGQPIEAKILQKEEARQIYDEIVRQLRDPALLEYVDNNAIQANVFPIPPHEERRIELEYSQVLPAEEGLVHYVYPQSTDLYTNTPLDSQRIRVEVTSREPIHAIYSPSHPVDVVRQGEYNALVGFEDQNVTANEDFELYYSVTAAEIGLNLLSYREPDEDGFFMLLVAPEVETEEVVAKDVILVLDTSGSMEGSKLEQAEDAAVYIVDHLNPGDRFNIISFSTGIRRYAPDLVPATDPGQFESYINSLEALGGTNISAALLEAAGQAAEKRPTTIVFVTDGLATEGIIETPLLLDAVAAATPENARIFAFGVGNDVDPELLDNLAQNHRGTTTYVRPNQAVDEAVSSFYAKVSSPVLSNISLDYGDIIVEQTYPQVLPDLFAGTQLVVTGRYRAGGPAAITLSGEVNGQPQQFVYEDNIFRTQGGDAFIPRLWATRATGHLLRQIRLHGEKDELVQSVVNLSIRYGIITPYTSYLIEEDDIFTQTGRESIVAGEMRLADEAFEAPLELEVEEAAAQAEMVEAEAPIAAPTMVAGDGSKSESDVQSLVEFVGSKTFVWRDGGWVDTAYEEDQHKLIEIDFAGEEYFELLSSTPEIGQYLALGQQVLVIHNGQAYQIVAVLEDRPVEVPEQPGDSTLDQSPQSEPPKTTAVAAQVTPEFNGEQPPSPAPASNFCTALLALPGLLALGSLVTWYGRRRILS